MSALRYVVSEGGYGRNLWVGSRLRLDSAGALTPMKPHVYRGWDEFCNPTVALHLWPLFGFVLWWSRRLRTYDDGRCAACIAEGWTDDAPASPGPTKEEQT